LSFEFCNLPFILKHKTKNIMAVIETEGLSKDYRVGFTLKKIRALENLNLEVMEKEIFGFLGPNGAGKTTTLKILMGLIYPSSGKARIFDKDIRDISIKNEIGFLPEGPYFYDYLTGKEFLNFYGELFGIEKKRIKAKVDELLETVGLTEAGKLQLRRYSKGMLQRIGIAQTLINDPKLVILDEPMSGLDPIGRKEIRDLILQLKDMGKTVFFSSHILSDVEMICDRVAILVGGRLIDVGSVNALLKEETGSVEICVSAISRAALEKINTFKKKVIYRGERVYITVDSEEEKDEILKKIFENKSEEKVRLISIIPQKKSLEALFFKEIKNKRQRGSD